MSNFTKLKLCHTFGISQSTHFWVKGALTASLLVLCGNVAKAQSDLTFNKGIRYSQWVIDSRLGDFYGNKRSYGFTTYNNDLSVKKEKTTWIDTNGTSKYSIKVDYVAGLVAKATIEAAEYYKNFDWSKPWFKSVEWYGNKCTVSTTPNNLDEINASKMYFGIYNLATGAFSDNDESNTVSTARTQLGNALTALSNYNKNHVFTAGTTLNNKDIAGGWFHKESYSNQMWLDGLYMGPATLAQLINGYSSYSSNKLSDNDWDLITKQFTIVWEQCWNSNEKLLNHAFSSEKLSYWTSDPDIWDTAQADKTKWTSMTAAGHSAAFWGRAEGWYFLALVDVLEQMVIAGQEKTNNYSTLFNYLITLADGIRARQDNTTGCWYQLIAKNGSYSASYYRGKTYSAKSNYLESSCTALFTAAYLKAIRLGFLAKDTYFSVAENAYKGMIEQFMKQRTDGTVDLLGCCKSAGLGTSTDFNDDKFRDGSNAYYLLGADVTPTSTNSGDDYTEGKVLGAFILAATEYERQYQSPMLLSKDLNKSYTLGPNESLSAEVLGEGTATYQWFDATGTTPSAIDGATNASYTPTKSGKYYCKITVNPTTAAKTRAASTEPYTITTSTADVTVNEVTPPSESTNAVVWTFTNSTKTSGTLGTAGNEVTFTSIDASSTVMTYVSGRDDAIGSSSKTINGVEYSSYLKENGKGSVSGNRRMEFNAPSSKGTVTIVYAGKAAPMTIVDGGNNNAPLAKLNATANTAITSDVLTTTVGNKIIIYCPENKSYIYSVIWTPINEPTGPSISISTQPESTDYLTGATVTPLTVVATLDGYSLSYQWYENTTNSNTGGNPISGATAASYTPTLSNTGTTYYYCVVTATKEGSETLTATSDVAAITVSEAYVKFTTQPKSGSYSINNAASALKVVAATNLGVDITYQWYSNSSETTVGATQITDATSSSYTPSTSTVGTTYYYCIATAQKDGTTVTATSNIVSVTVATAIYSYKVKSGETAPGINTSKYITDNNKNKLVKMTFGGWKWGTNPDQNNHTYTMPNKDKPLTDSWSAATTEGVDKLYGYDYWFEGTQDAVDESRALTGTIYGTPRYGWFVSPTRVDGKTTESHPYTLPVRGSFMTFEPTQNGTLSIYILQNGAWNTNRADTYEDPDGEGTITFSKGQIVAGEFRPHAFHVVNQRGLTVQEFSPNYSVDTKQTVNGDYYCMFKGDKGFDQKKYDDPHNVARWTEFKDYMSEGEKQRCHDNWNNGDGGAQTIIELDNGSFLAIEKGITKYTFHVTGNETYYFFSNFSKMGFAGASFLPDESQPTATPAEGQISTLNLSDVTAYDKITATENGTIGSTNLNNYTYSINGTDIAPVAGVSIPQFYSIKLDRTFKAGQWTTLTLPFNLTEEEVQKIFGDGTRLVMLHDATLQNEGARLTFIYHEIQNVLPGYPYLIKPTLTDIANDANDANVSVTKANNTITSFTVYGKCINPFIDQFEVNTTPYTFKGTPDYCTAKLSNNNNVSGYSVNYKANDIFVSEGDGKLYVSGGTSYGKGYRAWLQKKEGTTGVKSISVVMSSFSDDDDTTTSIDVADMAPDLIEALGIQTGVYNLSGQRVANDTRNLKAGIYIVNGKKTVVR